MAELALAKQVPLHLSIDDTVIEKKKPSSQTKQPMEGTGWHYSHLAGKQVFGYQVFDANISASDVSLCYCLQQCCPENGSKIDMAVELLASLPETDARVIFQMDSWLHLQTAVGQGARKRYHSDWQYENQPHSLS